MVLAAGGGLDHTPPPFLCGWGSGTGNRYIENVCACTPMAKVVALVGSSGGSTLRSDARSEYAALKRQLETTNLRLGMFVYVEALEPLDHAKPEAPVALWQYDEGSSQPGLTARARAPLSTVAEATAAADMVLAKQIEAGAVAALILASADVKGANASSIRAAARLGIPVLGTGGTGLGLASELGAFMLQLSGSVSTTADGRAMATSAALARHFGAPFSPNLPPSDLQALPVLDAALPIVVSLALLRRVSLGLRTITSLVAPVPAAYYTAYEAMASAAVERARHNLLPLALATVGGGRAAALGESGTVAGLVAGCLTTAAGAAGPVAPAALAAGYAAGLCARRVLGATHACGVPATASAHLVSGGAGLVGAAVGLLIAWPSAILGDAVRTALAWPATLPQPAAIAFGSLAGVATLAGSIHGYYHCVMLPLIMLEMEEGSLSTLGALDAACLCATCAGVMIGVGNSVGSPSPTASLDSGRRRASAGWSAAQINFLFGDYVEAYYPHMEKHWGVCVATYAGAAAAGAIVVGFGPARSSAYLPLPLAVVIAEEPGAMLCACVLAFVLPFLGSRLWCASAGKDRVKDG